MLPHAARIVPLVVVALLLWRRSLKVFFVGFTVCGSVEFIDMPSTAHGLCNRDGPPRVCRNIRRGHLIEYPGAEKDGTRRDGLIFAYFFGPAAAAATTSFAGDRSPTCVEPQAWRGNALVLQQLLKPVPKAELFSERGDQTNIFCSKTSGVHRRISSVFSHSPVAAAAAAGGSGSDFPRVRFRRGPSPPFPSSPPM